MPENAGEICHWNESSTPFVPSCVPGTLLPTLMPALFWDPFPHTTKTLFTPPSTLIVCSASTAVPFFLPASLVSALLNSTPTSSAPAGPRPMPATRPSTVVVALALGSLVRLLPLLRRKAHEVVRSPP